MNLVSLSGKVVNIRQSKMCKFITVKCHRGKYIEFIDVTLFPHQREFFDKYFTAGQWVNIIGHIRRSKEETDAGNIYKIEIVADEIGFCGDKDQTPNQITPQINWNEVM